MRYTHGVSHTPEYRVWKTMLRRCNSPLDKNWHNYGGRGIKVCERWNHVLLFIADMGNRPSPNHSLDRINTDGDYTPGNCRWATREEQANNKRTNRRDPETGLTAAETAKITGIPYHTIKSRLKSGLSATIDARKRVTYVVKGEERYLVDLAKEYDVNYSALYARLKRGMAIEDALGTAIRPSPCGTLQVPSPESSYGQAEDPPNPGAERSPAV